MILKHNLSTQASITLLLSLVGVLSLLSFAIIRALKGQWLVSAIDMILLSGVIAIAVYIWRSGQTRIPCLVLTIFYTLGIIAIIYLIGPTVIYWLFPMMIAAFFLVMAFEAVAINMLALLILTPKLTGEYSLIELVDSTGAIIVLNIFGYIFATQLASQRKQLVEMASKDYLTETGNRRELAIQMDKAIAMHNRSKQLTSIIILDIDHFKSINDNFGHDAGDRILINLARELRKRIRSTDDIFRYGGEEFVIIVTGADKKTTFKLAEDLRELVQAAELLPECPVTISLGVAEIVEHESREDWLRRADVALYKSKNLGRNTVSVID